MKGLFSSAFRASCATEPGSDKSHQDQILTFMTGDVPGDTNQGLISLRRLFEPLTRAYEDVFKPSFKLAHDLEPRALWLQRLLGWKTGISNAVILCGNNMEEGNKTPSIKALRVAEFYKEHGTGQLTWVAVNKVNRQEGLGLMMVLLGIRALRELAHRNGETLDTTIIEVNNPRRVNAGQYSDAKRPVYETFEKWGARFVPIEYRRPNVARGDVKKTDEFSLMVYPDARTGRYPDKAQLRQALRGIYVNEGVENPEDDADFIAMTAALDACPPLTEVNTGFVRRMESFERWLRAQGHRIDDRTLRLDEAFKSWSEEFDKAHPAGHPSGQEGAGARPQAPRPQAVPA